MTDYERYREESQWGEPEPLPKARRRLSSMISVRLLPAEADTIRAAARRAGLGVSAFLRRAALFAARCSEHPRVGPMETRAAGIRVHVLNGCSYAATSTYNAAVVGGSDSGNRGGGSSGN